MTETIMEILVTDRPQITVHDRCDRCGVQARLRASFISGDLYFCGHHAKTLQPHLKANAITIYDPERYMEKQEPLG